MADFALATFAALVIAARLVVAVAGYRSGLAARDARRRLVRKPNAVLRP